MKNLLILAFIVIICSGCSATIGLKFDGEKWGITFGGDVPQIPLIDYSEDIN